jgi:hypothetical protein
MPEKPQKQQIRLPEVRGVYTKNGIAHLVSVFFALMKENALRWGALRR